MKVWPTSERVRKTMRHPAGGIGFPSKGPAEWPDDAFTFRRIRDGDVSKEAVMDVMNGRVPSEERPRNEEQVGIADRDAGDGDGGGT